MKTSCTPTLIANLLLLFSLSAYATEAPQDTHGIPENVFGFVLTDNGPEMLPLTEPSWPETQEETTWPGIEDWATTGPQVGPVYQEDIILQEDEELTDHDYEIKKRAPEDCVVQGAQTHTNVLAHNPLQFPWYLTSPAPGAANQRQMGPVVGPIQNSPDFFAGTSFEFDATLNGVHGCTSRQFKKSVSMTVSLPNNNAGLLNGDVQGAFVPDALPNGVELYRGSTRTGARVLPVPGGATVYEGTPDHIRWIDAPGLLYQRTPAPLMEVQLQYLISIAYDSSGTSGWVCFSGQLSAIDLRNTRPIPANQLQNLIGNIVPGAGANAALRFNVNFINNLVGWGAFNAQTNPNFRTVRCRHMDPIPAALR